MGKALQHYCDIFKQKNQFEIFLAFVVEYLEN